MVKKIKDTQHKIYINIKVYQTNSPPKLIISKNFFPLTWSSPLSLLLPWMNDIQFSNFSPFSTQLSKGIKRKRKKTRNHRPTRKRKTRCYGHKDNKKYAKHVKNNACKRISIDPPGVEKLSQELSQLIHQVSRSCRDCDKKKLKKLDKQQGIEEVSSRLLKLVCRDVKNIDMNAIQHATQSIIQSTQQSLN